MTFQALARQRKHEGSVLLRASQYAGSYLMMGYAVECALKACICRNTLRDSFPRRDAHNLYVHNLGFLRDAAGLGAEMNAIAALRVNWATVKDWNLEAVRYGTIRVDRALASDYYAACTARTFGVLSWVRGKW